MDGVGLGGLCEQGDAEIRRCVAEGGDGVGAGAVGEELANFCREALAHLGAAVVRLHRAAGVDEDERARLVVVFEREADAELDRSDGAAALGLRVIGIPLADGGAAGGEIGRGYQFIPDAGDAVAFDLLAVVGGVGFAVAMIEIPLADLRSRSAAIWRKEAWRISREVRRMVSSEWRRSMEKVEL